MFDMKYAPLSCWDRILLDCWFYSFWNAMARECFIYCEAFQMVYVSKICLFANLNFDDHQ